MKTIRFNHPDDGQLHLGVLRGDEVYSVTRLVPSWTDPVPMWQALSALDISPSEIEGKFCVGHPLSFADIEKRGCLLAPVASPEVWASGVTYERSRDARNAETQIADSVYDRVYVAQRPELFFKATAERIVAPGKPLRLRSDSTWMVPEPEVSLVISADGSVIGWTIGNDMSSRDIEGENPLYLPQAKMFAKSCSLGPVLLWNTGAERPATWEIELRIWRGEQIAFSGHVPLSQFRRKFDELVAYLRRDNCIQDGTALMTGTGIVPPDDFTLHVGDVVEIAVSEIGVLKNPIEG